MTTTPDAPIATPTPEIFDSGPVEGVPGVVIAADAENPPARLIWAGNVMEAKCDEMIHYMAQPTRTRSGWKCVRGLAFGTEKHSAEALTAMGLVGIYRVDTP